MNRRILLASPCAAVFALAAGAPRIWAADAAHVTIDNFSFSPGQITVVAGTRVTWTNRDDIPHTVTSSEDPRVMKSAPLDTGDDYAFTFGRPGIYRYFCSLHPHMQGIVLVR